MPLFSPVSAGGIPKATVTATTGSPTIDSSSRAGKTIYKFTGSGSITIGTAGTCEMLLIGGGGAGCSPSAGGAGGYVYDTAAILQAGTLTVTIGAGATRSTDTRPLPGNPSAIKNLIALGGGSGGAGGTGENPGGNGGSGGGGTANSSGGIAQLGQGSNGGVHSQSGAGGGAGASPGTGLQPGGVGLQNSITGTATYYAGGGGSFSSVSYAGGLGGGGRGARDNAPTHAADSGTANTGGGGGGGNASFLPGNGGSGFVVIVIG